MKRKKKSLTQRTETFSSITLTCVRMWMCSCFDCESMPKGNPQHKQTEKIIIHDMPYHIGLA